MYSCKICTKKCLDIDSLMDHMTDHIKDSSTNIKTYCNNKNKRIYSGSEQSSKHNFESNNGVNNGENFNDTVTAANNSICKQINDTSSVDAVEFDGSINDTISGSDDVPIKVEQLDTDNNCLETHALATQHFGPNKDTPAMQTAASPIHVTYIDDYFLGFSKESTVTEAVSNETIQYERFAEKNNPITNTECKRSKHDTYEGKTVKSYVNKRNTKNDCEFSRNSILVTNGDTIVEENDALLAVKQEELSTNIAVALKFSKNNAIISTETEVSSTSEQLKADVIVNNAKDIHNFSSYNDTKNNLHASCTRSRIQFESDDEIRVPVRVNSKAKQKGLDKMYTCKLCEKQFARKNTLIIHMVEHRGIMPFTCDICDAQHATLSSLNVHKNKHKEKNYSCDICQKRFTCKPYLKNHLIIHTSLKKFECEFCEKKFMLIEQLKRHLVVHTGVKKWSCVECDVSFRNYSSLSYHREKVHLKLNIRVNCEICKKTFANRHSMLSHKRHKHSDLRGYACTICKKVFKYKESRQKHMGIHNGYALKCSFCEKGFSAKYQLVRHERRHTGEKPFQCDYCGGRYQKKESVTYHITNRICQKKRAKSEKSFYCDVCKKGFTTKRYLESHIFKCEKKKGKSKRGKN